eukprot:COSAG06_NODE_29948_length_547_cov_6.363839_1_plen_23_part_10
MSLLLSLGGIIDRKLTVPAGSVV